MTDRGVATTRAVLGALAACLVGMALALVGAPGLVPGGVVASARGVANEPAARRALLLSGAVAGVYGAFSLWVWRAPGRAEWLADRAPEAPEREVTVSGSDLTATFDRRCAGDGVDGTADDGPLGDRLRATLLALYDRDGSDEAVAEYVDAGRWTDDRYAAAFVTATDEVDYPLAHRLFAWLYPGRAYEHRARRALTAVEDACGERAVGYDPPDRGRAVTDWVRALLGNETGGTDGRHPDGDAAHTGGDGGDRP